MNLSGLSATYPGYQAAVTTDLSNQQNQAAAQEAQNKLLGAHVLGRALGGLPGSQPMAPAPGQASVPSQPAPGGGGASPPAFTPPSGAPAGAPAMAPMGELNLKDLTQRIIQTSPQVAQRPEVLMAALERAAPLLDRQGKEDLLDARKQMQLERITAASTLARERLDEAKRTHDAVAAAKAAHEKATQDRFDAKEKRLAGQAAVRQDQTYARLDMQRQDLERKISESGDKNALAAWRIVVNEQANRARAVIQANSVNTDLSPADKAGLLADIDKQHNETIAAMRAKIGSTTPTGGVTPPGQPVAPKVQGQVPQAAAPVAPAGPGGTVAPPAATPVQAPPLAMLKQGTITTFQNGQKWTIGANGQPEQVP